MPTQEYDVDTINELYASHERLRISVRIIEMLADEGLDIDVDPDITRNRLMNVRTHSRAAIRDVRARKP